MAGGLLVASQAEPSLAAAAGQVTLGSHTSAGPTTASDGTSDTAMVSGNGAFVVFASTGSDLVSGQVDSNNAADVFLLERSTGVVTLVSHTPAGTITAGSGTSTAPSISADGSFVSFYSLATDLVSGQTDANSTYDVFLYARATGVVTLVSHVAAGAATTGSGLSFVTSISADGAFVAFQSSSTNLVAGQTDSNSAGDVFLYTRTTGAVTLVSHIPAGATTTGTAEASSPSISANGAFVTFQSSSTNLVSGQADVNSTYDVFVYARATGAVTLVSHVAAGGATTGNGVSFQASISADGAFVTFQSSSTNLVSGQADSNGDSDVWVFSQATGTVTLVSHTPTTTTTTGNGGSAAPSISADGAFVAFSSLASNLVSGQTDTNADSDAFLYSRATGAVTLVSHTPVNATTTGNVSTYPPTISANGAFVAFHSNVTNLVAGQNDTNAASDVFLYARATGAVTLVSHTPDSAGTTGTNGSGAPSISAAGSFVAFTSYANNLVSGQTDTNGSNDVFLFRRTTSQPPVGDFNGDGSADIAVFRPSNGGWYIQGQAGAVFGTAADIPVPGDYNGDGTTDIAVFRPSSGGWYIQGQAGAVFGTSTDIPVPGDYNGDGKTDIAVFRPSNGAWYVLGQAGAVFGTSTDIPVPGDYNGDGTTDIAVFRPSNGAWYVLGQAGAVFGTSTDIPVPGDYNGDSTTDIAVFRPSNGGWYVLGQTGAVFGASGDKPVAGDFNGDGNTDIAVFRPSNGGWYIQGQTGAFFGTSTDIPV